MIDGFHDFNACKYTLKNDTGTADSLPYEKVGKNEPVCIADEVLFEIPESWEWVRISTIFTLQAGKNIKAADIFETNFDGSYLCYGGNGIRGYVKSYNREGPYPIIGRQGALCGNIKYAKGKFYATEHAVCVETFAQTNVKWACAFLEALNLNQYATATAQPGLAVANINTVLIPLPPKNEQQRIVDRLFSLQTFIKAYAKKIYELNFLNQQFSELLKKSILQEAVKGNLVPQDSSDEPASVLLERIRAEKERMIQEGKIKRNKHESVIYRRDNSHYEKCGFKEKNIDEIIPFELPTSWEWIRLSAILTSTDAGKSPQCESRPKNDGEWGVIKTTAIQDGYFLATENKVLPLNFDIVESTIVNYGDLLITRAGPRNRTGVICVVDKKIENLILSDKTVRLSYLREFVDPYYVMMALSSPAMKYFIIDAMTGMAASQVNISQEKMKTFLLPLPPLNEQKRIVTKIAALSDYARKLNF